MRIPVPIAISSCFLVMITSWYFGTQDKDFTQPPSEKEKEEISKHWNTKAKGSRLPSPTPKYASQKKFNQNSPKLIKPKPLSIPLLATGDIEKSPELSEYKIYKNHSSKELILLAKKLESLGARNYATLAWERILDTTQGSKKEIKQATGAINRLKKTLPPWNADPQEDIIITLHAGATLKEKNNLKTALHTTAKIISETSGHIIKIKLQLTFGKNTPASLPRVPIAIWFTGNSKKLTTSPLSFLGNADDTALLTSQCQAAVYSLLSEHLKEHTSYPALPNHSAEVTPKELLQSYITRLMWREFAFSLTRK